MLERLAVLDIEAGAPLADVTRTMTALAEVTLAARAGAALAEQDARHGAPLQRGGRRASTFWVVGMGKLGARELNVSSDIDLIYVYDEDGQTAGAPRAAATPSGATNTSPSVARSAVRADRRDHRRRLRVPRRPRAAAERQFGPVGGEPGDAGGVLPGAGPRVGALRLAQEPRGGAGGRHDRGARAAAARPRGRLRVPALPRLRRVRGPAPAAPQDPRRGRSAAPPAGPSGPTTSSSRAAASARSSSPCSCCRWCAAASSRRSARAPR